MRPLFDLLVFAHLYRMVMNSQMQAGMKHVSGSIYIIDSGSTSCNIDRWNFTNLIDKCRHSKCGLSNWNCRHRESIPFPFIDRGGAMNTGSVSVILILTMEVAYTCRSTKCQATITLNIRCNCLGPSMTIMTLVYSMHHMNWT